MDKVHSNGAGRAEIPSAREGFDFVAEFKASCRVLAAIVTGASNSRNAAEDIFQEAAFQVLGKLSQFQPGTDFTV